MVSEQYIWTVTSTLQRRHLASALVGGQVPGRTGMSLCGRTVMDFERAAYWHGRQVGRGRAPRYDDLDPCENCVRVGKVVTVARRGDIAVVGTDRLPQPVVDYARRANAAELALRRVDDLLREVMVVLGSGHPLGGRRVNDHADCDVCDLLRRIRFRLASTDRAATTP